MSKTLYVTQNVYIIKSEEFSKLHDLLTNTAILPVCELHLGESATHGDIPSNFLMVLILFLLGESLKLHGLSHLSSVSTGARRLIRL